MEFRYWLRQNRRRLLRLSPTILLTTIAVLGMIFPDQIKAVLAQPVGIAAKINTHTSRPSHFRLNSVALTLVIFGIVQIILAWVVDVHAEKPDPGALKEEEFVKNYTNAIGAAVGLLAYLPSFDEPRREEAIKELLKILCTVAEVYKGVSLEQRFDYNVCFYRAVDASAISQEQLDKAKRFMDEDRTSYGTFLELTQWAYNGELKKPSQPGAGHHPKPCVETGFVWPVDDKSQYTLFGVAFAYKNKTYYAVTDIKNEGVLKKLPGMSDNMVQTSVLRFFRAVSSYQSFVCLPVYDEKGTHGVVSIQANVVRLCDLKKKFDQQMLTSMEPFLTVLALLVSSQSKEAQ